jgi:hypothetical protein
MKHRRGKEKYIKWCTRMERNGIVWIKARMWKLRVLEKDYTKEVDPYVSESRTLNTYYLVVRKQKSIEFYVISG